MMYATLVEVSQVPPGQLGELDKVWSQQVRELSYDMEDAVDAFMVRVHGCEPASGNEANILKKIFHKAAVEMKKYKSRREISDRIKGIRDLSKELSELHDRYKFSGTAHSSNTRGVDPRVINLNKNKGRELIGIWKARDELLRMLTYPEGSKSLKIISIVGSGGLGKTTLAQVVHEQLKAESFDCCAFVSVGRNPSITSTLREMLKKLLDKEYSSDMNEERLCMELLESLKGKRYNIVVDDVWDKETWEAINCALPDGNCGSKVIMTTRNCQVSNKDNGVYRIKPLSPDDSKELFYKRTSRMNVDNKLIDKIIDKCDGVPLAIIAIASLLADRPLEDWQMVYDSLIFGNEEDHTRTILLYSYYDLPPYLKPCLLYLSMYPEDHLIEKSTLVWRWIAEGFVKPEKKWRSSLFEVGERYFDELLNRSMIQPAEVKRRGIIDGCHVHDIVLDLIRDLSTEENFVTVIGEKQSVSSESVKRMKQVGLQGFGRKMRRISIQWYEKYISQDTIGMPEVVRSLHVTDCVIGGQLSSFQAIRVLSKRRRTSKIGDLKHLSKLRHLRYLEIPCDECPKEIGNLKSLQTLIIYIRKGQMPPIANVFELTQLMCLCINSAVIWNVPADKMGNLKCLEELELQIFDTNEDSLVELGRMTRLRVLKICFADIKETWYKALMHSLNNLQEIRELYLWTRRHRVRTGMAWESWEPPRHLWSLETNLDLSPQLMDPSHFQHIRYLCLPLDFMEAGVGNLALLRELLSLSLFCESSSSNCQGLIIRAGFENLRVCKADTQFKFLQGAMPRLESLVFKVWPGSDLDFNLATILFLKEVIVDVDCSGYFHADVVETEAVVERAVKYHPNCPTLQMRRIYTYNMLPDDKMKPDKVVCALLNVREGRRDGYHQICWDVEMRYYRSLEEINCDIDCEGSKLLEVEEVEEILRRQAARHISRPKLVMNRINEDKMLGDDDASVDS